MRSVFTGPKSDLLSNLYWPGASGLPSVCGALRIIYLTFSVGTVKVKVDGRSCVPDRGSNGCASDNKDFRNIMKATNLLTTLTYRYTIEDVDVCSCSEDLCNGGCSGTNILVGHNWYVFV